MEAILKNVVVELKFVDCYYGGQTISSREEARKKIYEHSKEYGPSCYYCIVRSISGTLPDDLDEEFANKTISMLSGKREKGIVGKLVDVEAFLKTQEPKHFDSNYISEIKKRAQGFVIVYYNGWGYADQYDYICNPDTGEWKAISDVLSEQI